MGMPGAVWAQVQVRSMVVFAEIKDEGFTKDLEKIRGVLLLAAVAVVAYLATRFNAWKAVATTGLIALALFAGYITTHPAALDPLWSSMIEFITGSKPAA